MQLHRKLLGVHGMSVAIDQNQHEQTMRRIKMSMCIQCKW